MNEQTHALANAAVATLTDEEIAQRVVGGETALFELLMRRNNPRIYRAVRSVLRDEAETEDAMQQAYVSAYQHLADFAGNAKFSTWLTRIAVNEALGRLRRGRRFVALAGGRDATEDMVMERPDGEPTPEEAVGRREITRLIEQAIDSLPEHYRTVFVLREVEGLSTAEVADAMDLKEDAVKTRLHRARHMLQERLLARASASVDGAFPFHAPRCDRVVQAVMRRIEELARR